MTPLKRVLLPQPIESEAVAILEKEAFEIVLSSDPKPETVRPLLGDAHALILRTGIKITKELLSSAHKLRIISRTGGGMDNVDLDAATEKKIIVTSNLGVNTSSVVEHVLSLMFALSKQLFVLDRAVRSDNFKVRYKNLPRDIRRKTLGLLGFGRIGSQLGRVCHEALQMRIMAFDPLLQKELKEQYSGWMEFTDIKRLFSSSDVISVHIPLTDNTFHAVGEKELSWMKPEALLINTSRGPVIDQQALVRALREKRIGGAGLDVFNQEPVPKDDPLLNLENVILTPHTAALTKECVIRMATEAAKCVVELSHGREPRNVANRQVLSSDRWRHIVPRPNE